MHQGCKGSGSWQGSIAIRLWKNGDESRAASHTPCTPIRDAQMGGVKEKMSDYVPPKPPGPLLKAPSDHCYWPGHRKVPGLCAGSGLRAGAVGPQLERKPPAVVPCSRLLWGPAAAAEAAEQGSSRISSPISPWSEQGMSRICAPVQSLQGQSRTGAGSLLQSHLSGASACPKPW